MFKIFTNAHLNRRPFEPASPAEAESVLVVPGKEVASFLKQAADSEKPSVVISDENGSLADLALRLGYPESCIFIRKHGNFVNLSGSVSVPEVRGGIRLKDIEALLQKAREESWVADPVLVIDSDDGEIVPVPGDKDEPGMTLLSLMRSGSRTA